MCRNIRALYNFEPPASKAEVEAAALQFVRKVSGFRKPSQANRSVFENAVAAIYEEVEALLAQLQTSVSPRNRDVEAEKRRLASQLRFRPGRSND